MANNDARKYSIGRPLQNVRLTNWPAGRVAQLKTAIQRLESMLNTSASSQITQPEKRQFSTRVPLITEFTVRAGVRNFQVVITAPRGIDDVLFYEIQHDTSSVFSNPSTITSPTNTVSVGGVSPGTVRYARVRVVNSKFQAGPWSEATAFSIASYRIQTQRFGEATSATTFTNAELDTWKTLDEQTYVASGGAVSVISHISIHADEDSLVQQSRFRTTQVTAEFRILRDGVQVAGSGNGLGTAKAAADGNLGFDGLDSAQDSVVSYTLVTPFETLEGGSYVYTVEARISDAHSVRRLEISGVPSFPALNTTSVYSDLFDVLEVVTNA